MNRTNVPIQVIIACNINGSITPLRFRYEDDEHKLQTINITNTLNTKDIKYVGLEAMIFTCKAKLGDIEKMFELRYMVNAHKWFINRMLM